ncbi:hypothetical protein ACS0TY_006810 [Phlomoides rotata]
MGTIREKGYEDRPPPPYPPDSDQITLVLHYGGLFVAKPTADYIGGDKVVYDSLSIIKDIKISNLNRWFECLGILGERKYYVIHRNGFNVLLDEFSLMEECWRSVKSGKIDVYVEGTVETQGSDGGRIEDDQDDQEFEAKGINVRVHGSRPLSPLVDSDFEYDPENEKRVMRGKMIRVGMVFGTKDEFRKAVQSHAIQSKRSIHFVKNDKIRVYARCMGDGCNWGINLVKMQNESTFQQAYRAKTKALEIIEGFPYEQYSKLWDYAQELRNSNLNSTIILDNDEEGRFRGMYLCFDAVKRGFKSGCRPFIGVETNLSLQCLNGLDNG